MIDNLSEDELRDIATQLGIDYSQLFQTIKARKTRKVLGLVMETERRQQTPKLTELCQRIRPDIAWRDRLQEPDHRWSPEGKVSESIIHKLNTELGMPSQTRFILLDGENIDTGCVSWPLAQEDYFEATRKADEALSRVRQLIKGEPVTAYKGDLSWIAIDSTSASCLVVAPTTDQFDILRFERTDGGNYLLATEDIIEKISVLDGKYGIDITGAGGGAVEFFLKRTPKGEEAQQLGKWLYEWCPDIYESPTEFPSGRIALWWD